MKKKIISIALLGATTSLLALGAEHAYLYKDPRVMGMGGANVAVGSYSTSIFSNPAGLASISKKDGFVVDLLSLGLSTSSGTSEFVSDIQDADTDLKMTNILQKYSGEHFHLGVNDYMSVSKNSDSFAWSVGLLAATDINYQTHPNGSTNGGLLASTSRVYGGVVIGGAKPFETKIGRVDVGVGIKYVSQKSYEGALGITELVNSDNLAQDLQNKYEKTSSGFGVDLGVTYHPFKESKWHPSFGLSVLNIGSMQMDNNFGQQPMSVNIGAAVSPELKYVENLVLAIDYVDMFNANTIREYTYNEVDGSVGSRDYEDVDFMKRLRLGAGIGLVDSTYFSTTLNVGMYQASYTAGLDMAITAIKLNFSTYQEQVGTGSVNIPDRRYMAQIGIGW